MTDQIRNANVYIDGTSYMGKAREVQLPEIKQKMNENKALGMFGTKKLPAGLEALESRIKWASWLPEVMKKAANPYKPVDIMVRGNYETYSSAGIATEQPAICYMKATFQNIPLGTIQQNENVEVETQLAVDYLKLVVNGVELFEVDIDNNIYIVDGVDLLRQFRQNLGIS